MYEFPDDAPNFSLRGTRTVRVISLHDGDTFTAIFRFEESFYKFSVRLGRIDTCEMTTTNSDLKLRALLARNRLFELITGTHADTIQWTKKNFDDYFRRNPTHLTINCANEMDKYGRVLCDVGDFAETLVREKLAFWYDGGKKLTEDEMIKNMFGDTIN
jgi:endonuclease YncB( thermonuclease family)